MVFLGAENKKSSPPLTREPMDGFFSGLNQSVALTFKFNKGLYDQCRRMLSSPQIPKKLQKSTTLPTLTIDADTSDQF